MHYDLKNNNPTKIYPNPFTEKIYFECLCTKNIKITITSTSGQEIVTQDLLDNKTELKLNFLERGFYYLKIQQDAETKYVKLLKNE